jgi:hypothetical protein
MVVNFLFVLRIYLGVIPNERTYREHFGTMASVTTAMWEWLESHELVPPLDICFGSSRKTNALQARCCQFIGGIDKNTFIKWCDLMEDAVSNLPVVSNNFFTFDSTNTIY